MFFVLFNMVHFFQFFMIFSYGFSFFNSFIPFLPICLYSHAVACYATNPIAFKMAVNCARKNGTVVAVGLPPGEFPCPIIEGKCTFSYIIHYTLYLSNLLPIFNLLLHCQPFLHFLLHLSHYSSLHFFLILALL